MELLFSWCRKHRAGLVGLLLLGFCFAAVGWSIYAAPAQNTNHFSYTIYNDDYTTTLPMGIGGWEHAQPLTLKQGQRVYGLRLLFDTDGVSTQGTFEAWLESPEGVVLASTGSLNAAALLDGDFQGLPFVGEQGFWEDNPHVEGIQAVLKMRYAMDENWAEPHPLTLWCSDSGELALQLMTENTTGWAEKLAMLAAVPLLLAVVLGWVLLVIRKTALPKVYLVCALLLGLAFALITPVQVGPDEYAHLAGSYGMVNRWGGQTDFREDGTLAVRACDAPHLMNRSGEIGPIAYKRLLLGLGETGQSGELTASAVVRAVDTSVWYLYLPHAFGILLGRAMGLGFYGMVLLARLTVLLLSVLLMTAALHTAPQRARPLFFVVALLPMSLQMSGVLSTDGVILGIGCWYLALCLTLSKKTANTLEKVLLVGLAFLLGPAKSIYVLMVAFCAIIPAAHLGGKRPSLALKLGLAIAAIVGWAAFSGGYVLYILRDVDRTLMRRMIIAGVLGLAALGLFYRKFIRGNAGRVRGFRTACVVLCCVVPLLGVFALTRGRYSLTDLDVAMGIKSNGDSILTFSVGYVLHHLPATLKLIINSFATRSDEWLQGLLGITLGEPIVYPSIQVNWLLGIALVLVLLGVSLPVAGQEPIVTGWRCWLGLGIGVGVSLLCLAACITWTPINYTTLFGMQGRYLLPILPLLLLPLSTTKTVVLQRDKTAALTLSGIALSMLVVSQAFLLYCQGA